MQSRRAIVSKTSTTVTVLSPSLPCRSAWILAASDAFARLVRVATKPQQLSVIWYRSWGCVCLFMGWVSRYVCRSIVISMRVVAATQITLQVRGLVGYCTCYGKVRAASNTSR
jgi:hypothetical protein